MHRCLSSGYREYDLKNNVAVCCRGEKEVVTVGYGAPDECSLLR